MTEKQKLETTKNNKNNIVDIRTRVRISHDAKVHMLLGSDVFKGYLRDISQQGLYFFSNDVLSIVSQKEQFVFIELFMEHDESVLAVQTRGFVTRTDESGCAVSFPGTLLWWPVFSLFPTGTWDDEGQSYEEQDFMNPNSYDQQIVDWDIDISR